MEPVCGCPYHGRVTMHYEGGQNEHIGVILRKHKGEKWNSGMEYFVRGNFDGDILFGGTRHCRGRPDL